MTYTKILHSHITIKGTSQEALDAASLIKGKATVIDLENKERSQRDIMITNYYVVGKKDIKSIDDALKKMLSYEETLKEASYNVVRSKLELDIDDDRIKFDEARYYEVHVKYLTDIEKISDLKRMSYDLGWHPSNNPFQQNDDGTLIQFVNKRFKTEERLDTDTHSLMCDNRRNGKIKEIKYEAVVYDSNEQHDAWWL